MKNILSTSIISIVIVLLCGIGSLAFASPIDFRVEISATDGVNTTSGYLLQQRETSGVLQQKIFLNFTTSENIVRKYSIDDSYQVYQFGEWSPPTSQCCRNQPISYVNQTRDTINVGDTFILEREGVNWTLTVTNVVASGNLDLLTEINDNLDQVEVICPRACSAEADYVFIMDLSGSIDASEFTLYEYFAENLLNRLDIGADRVRLGIVSFSGQTPNNVGDLYCLPNNLYGSSTLWNLALTNSSWPNYVTWYHNHNVSDYNCFVLPSNQTNSGGYASVESPVSSNVTFLTDMVRAVSNLRSNYSYSFTSIGTGMRLGKELFERTDRNTSRVAIVMTDGENNRGESVNTSSAALRNMAKVYSLGVGQVNTTQLQTIAGGSDWFYATDFTGLDAIIDSLVQKSCLAIATANTPNECQAVFPPAQNTPPVIDTVAVVDPVAPGSADLNITITTQTFPINLTVSWGDSGSESLDPYGGSCSHNYSAPGNYTIVIVSTEVFGLSSNQSIPIVISANNPPVINSNVIPSYGHPPMNATVVFNAVDTDGFISYAELNFNGTVSYGLGNFTYIGLPSGTYTVNYYVVDNKGASANDTDTIIVNAAPTVNIVNVAPTNSYTPSTVKLNVSFTDELNSLPTVLINWGDSVETFNNLDISGIVTFNHTYTSSFTGTIVVTAYDFYNESGTAQTSIIIVSLNNPPIINYTINPSTGGQLLDVNINFTPSDNEGSVVDSGIIFNGTTYHVSNMTINDLSYGNYTVSFYATDDKNLTTTVNDVIVVTNADPIIQLVDATISTVTLEPAEITINIIDDLPTVKTVIIDWGDGTNDTYSNVATGDNIYDHTYQTPGFYDVTVTVVDNDNFTTTTTVTTINITQNEPPVVDVEIDPPFIDGNVTIGLNVSDPDGNDNGTTVVIDWGDGTNQTVEGGNNFYTHQYPTSGNYLIVIYAVDIRGQNTSVQVPIVINYPPTIDVVVTPPSGIAPVDVAINVTVSDPEHNLTSVVIDWGDGTIENITNLSGLEAGNPTIFNHQYANNGSYIIKVIVQDKLNWGNYSHAPVVFQYTYNISPNADPIIDAVFSQSDGNGETLINVNVTVSDPDTNLTLVTIDWGNGQTENISTAENSYSNYFAINYAPGHYTVIIRAYDNHGGVTEYTHMININAFPEISYGYTPTDKLIAPETVVFEVTVTDDSPSFSGVIDFGDGTQETFTSLDNQFNHDYNISGNYTIGIEVTDSEGASTEVFFNVIVHENILPVIELEVTPLAGLPLLMVIADASNSYDPDNQTLRYFWTFTDNNAKNNAKQINTRDTTFEGDAVANMTYLESGRYTVILEIVDTKGGSATASKDVIVAGTIDPGPGIPPVCQEIGNATICSSIGVNGRCINRFTNVTVFEVQNYLDMDLTIVPPNNTMTGYINPPVTYFPAATHTWVWVDMVENPMVWTITDPVTGITVQATVDRTTARACYNDENPTTGGNLANDFTCAANNMEWFIF